MISSQWVIDELKRYFHDEYYQRTSIQDCINCFIEDILTKLPSAQPSNGSCWGCQCEKMEKLQSEPLSDAYTKAVWTWLLNYQIKVAELKGRYTPYEVLSWVVNDWRKEHEGSD